MGNNQVHSKEGECMVYHRVGRNPSLCPVNDFTASMDYLNTDTSEGTQCETRAPSYLGNGLSANDF